ncbi:Uncharacterised protein [Vibrio cholerae]|nr:Uncharacterised protein [Vibrio cholerae]
MPEPTSPCTKRIIGCGLAKSASISATTRCCALVGEKGSCAKSCCLSWWTGASGKATSCWP